jgi:cytoskeletal protein RodZ
MADNIINNKNFSPNPALMQTLGAKLKQQREVKNFTVEAIAQQMHISKNIINCMEKNDYSSIVAPIYARGYLRSYAKIVNLPEEEILEEFEKLNIFDNKTTQGRTNYLASDQKIEIPADIAQHHTKIGIKHLITFIIILVGIILLALLIGQSWKKSIDANYNQTQSQEQTQAQSTVTLPTAGIGVTTDQPEVTPALPQTNQETLQIPQDTEKKEEVPAAQNSGDDSTD